MMPPQLSPTAGVLLAAVLLAAPDSPEHCRAQQDTPGTRFRDNPVVLFQRRALEVLMAACCEQHSSVLLSLGD